MFLVVTQWMPLRPTADRFDGCFCLGSGPVFGVSWCCFAFALFPLAKRKSGWGICGSSLFVWLWFSLFVLIDLLISRTYVLVQCFSCLLSCKDRALARHRPISRKKKSVWGVGPLGRSSNQVGRTDWTPIALVELAFLMLSLRRLW